MARATLERALCPQELDALFERCAQRQYTRDLLFPTATDLLSQAVCGTRQSAHAAYEAAAGDVAVSITSVYDKLAGVEPHVAAELVRSCAGRRAPVIGALGGFPEWLPGYRARLLDGNHLAATGHRLKETRACAAGPLPGSCLVVPGAATGPAEGAFPCEGGRARERALLGDVPGAARARDPWLGDRNLCVARFLAGIAARAALFITRAHRQVPLAAAGRLRPCGRVEAGPVRAAAATVT